MRCHAIMLSAVGPLRLVSDDAGEALERLDYASDAEPAPQHSASPLLRCATEQLASYFDGQRQAFDVPLSPRGTPFQQAVWGEIARCRFGQTCSYLDIAHALGRRSGARAIGQAVGRNPISIIIPCHRIVGSNGALVGYGGGLGIKRQLLALEGA